MAAPKLRSVKLDEVDPGTSTFRVLQELAKEKHGGTSHSSSHDDDDDEHEEHIDERWLVSYADMMTLLFGLFVLLFSMSSLDAGKFKKVLESAEKQFGATNTPTAPPVVLPPDQEAQVRAELEKKAARVDQMEREKKQQEDAIKDLTVQIQKLTEQIKRTPDPTNQAQQLATQTQQITQLTTDKTQLTTENEELKKKIAEQAAAAKMISSTNSNVDELKRKLVEAVKARQNLEDQVQISKKSIDELKILKNENLTIKKELVTKTAELEEAQKKLEALGGTDKSASFISIVINWPTTDHDIDLVVEDPEGKTFNFKKRKFPGHPGTFALDTRRGPGAEIWQAERIIPGEYKATYVFYNQYGNKDVCPVSGTVFTAKGEFDLPKVTLDFGATKKVTYTFNVTEDGRVTLK